MISLGPTEKGRDYPVKVTSVEVIPDPVICGEPATFRISASTGNQSQLCYKLMMCFAKQSFFGTHPDAVSLLVAHHIARYFAFFGFPVQL
jgi:hypothetical protein